MRIFPAAFQIMRKASAVLFAAAFLVAFGAGCQHLSRTFGGPSSPPQPRPDRARLNSPSDEQILSSAFQNEAGQSAVSQGPSARASAWEGRHIGQLVAAWGKPVSIRPAFDESGRHDYVFESRGRHAAYLPPNSFIGSRSPHSFNARFSPFSPELWDEYDSVNQLDCRAVVRVDKAKRVRRVNLDNNIPCARYSPFIQTPGDITDAQY